MSKTEEGRGKSGERKRKRELLGICFITGTDTGVGKTLLTALLLAHLRAKGRRAFALKPLSSGPRTDAALLCKLQDHDPEFDKINPFHFPSPVTPLVAARKERRRIPLHKVVEHIAQVCKQLCHSSYNPNRSDTGQGQESVLLIEGAGGLLAPLGENYSNLDLIHALNASVIVVARNRLGTINHTLLTLAALASQATGLKRAHKTTVVLMDPGRTDASSPSNARVLSELYPRVSFTSFPYLGAKAKSTSRLQAAAKKYSRLLEQIWRSVL